VKWPTHAAKGAYPEIFLRASRNTPFPMREAEVKTRKRLTGIKGSFLSIK